MKITLNLNQEELDALHELVESKYYETMNILEENLKTDKYKILSDKDGITVDRTTFEKEVCDYAKWIKIMIELSEQIT